MKYVIKKTRQGGTYHNMNFGVDRKTIKGFDLKSHQANGWEIERPIYPVITPIYNYWKKLSEAIKIAIITIFSAIFIALFLNNQTKISVYPEPQYLPDSNDIQLIDSDSQLIDSDLLPSEDSLKYKSKNKELKPNDSLTN